MSLIGAVVDTLLPGDDGAPALPSGTAAGVPIRIDAAAHREVLDAIARTAGGESAFVQADAAVRAAVLKEVEHAMPDAFATLLLRAIEEYYDADAVIAAFGWTVEPPHPMGHRLPAFDDGLLAKVKRRGALWRGLGTVPPSRR